MLQRNIDFFILSYSLNINFAAQLRHMRIGKVQQEEVTPFYRSLAWGYQYLLLIKTALTTIF